jgi:hypothetical protein
VDDAGSELAERRELLGLNHLLLELRDLGPIAADRDDRLDLAVGRKDRSGVDDEPCEPALEPRQADLEVARRHAPEGVDEDREKAGVLLGR